MTKVPEGFAVDPVTGYVHAPERLDDLPAGTSLGELDVTDAPRGTQTLARRIGEGWRWRIVAGEGWAVRHAYGPPRDSGVRPRLAILVPCRSVTLRAVGVDVAFPAVMHHVMVCWVRPVEVGRWTAEEAWYWSSEPAPDGDARCVATLRPLGVARCGQVLAGPPDCARIAPMIDDLEADDHE